MKLLKLFLVLVGVLVVLAIIIPLISLFSDGIGGGCGGYAPMNEVLKDLNIANTYPGHIIDGSPLQFSPGYQLSAKEISSKIGILNENQIWFGIGELKNFSYADDGKTIINSNPKKYSLAESLIVCSQGNNIRKIISEKEPHDSIRSIYLPSSNPPDACKESSNQLCCIILLEPHYCL